MANANLLDTKTVDLNELLGNGKTYRVPQFQRDYSWDQDNWEDLWNDMVLAESSGEPHYMGSIVLQTTGGKEFMIIDGQQRLATLSIFALAVIDGIQHSTRSAEEKSENEERFELLMRQYIGHKDASSLRYSSKLFLNENNDGFYQQRLVAFKEPINVKKLSDSETLLWGAYRFFQNKLSQKFNSGSGGAIAAFLTNVVGELMLFIQITVKDELNAYTVFETLNSRGVELTATDLLKNYLLSLVAKSETDLKQAKSQWKKIIDCVGLKEFPTFLRYYLSGTRKAVTKESLFKEIKNYVRTDIDVFELLDRLEYYAYNYVALGNPDDEFWNQDKDLRVAIKILKAFKVTQWKPLMMVAMELLPSPSLSRLAQAVVCISFRYNVVSRMQTNDMEKVYSKVAVQLFNMKSVDVNVFIAGLKELYVGDEDFKHNFSVKTFNTNNSSDKKLLRYTLYQLEAREAGGNLYDFEMDNGTIEHILPESFAGEWQSVFTEDEFERNVFLIGNLTLLEASKNNKEAANKSFEEKKLIYQTSKFKLTNTIDTHEWNSHTIKSRQYHLAKLATSVWNIQF